MLKLQNDIKAREDFLEFFGKTREEVCKHLISLKGGGKELRQEIFKEERSLSKNEVYDLYRYSDYSTIFLLNITDNWFSSIDSGYNEHLIFKLAFKKFSNPKDCKVLEWGCGWGAWGLKLAFLGYDVTLADIPHPYFNFLQLLCMKYLPVEVRVRFLPIPYAEYILSETYDYIISDEVLEHTFEPENTIQHLSDHLKEGGWIYLSYFFDDMRGEDPSHLHNNTLRYNDAQRFVGILVDKRLIPMARDHNGVLKGYQKLNGKLE